MSPKPGPGPSPHHLLQHILGYSPAEAGILTELMILGVGLSHVLQKEPLGLLEQWVPHLRLSGSTKVY